MDPLPQVEAGFVTRYADFPSMDVPPRYVDVWCPPGCGETEGLRYPVIYMHDGQNVFDPSLASTGIDWGVDEAVTRLMEAGKSDGAVVVGVWNVDTRWLEYMPQRPVEEIKNLRTRSSYRKFGGGDAYSDAYLKFLVEELKPFIDATYPTLPGQAQTGIMGSSMGGLISLYAAIQYPQVFGGAACLSTHWPAGGSRLVDWMGAALPSPQDHKLYFDFGTVTLDWNYERYQKRMDKHLGAAGYVQGQNCLTRKFIGHEHTERDWRARVEIPLEFLLSY